MNLKQVFAQLRNLEPMIPGPPHPLLSLVILSNGAGVHYAHPHLLAAESGTLEQREAALRLVRAFLVQLSARVDERIDEMVRASSRAAG
jgi:hypothetical protein